MVRVATYKHHRDANSVLRYHTLPVPKETVGHHCANVACMFTSIFMEASGALPSPEAYWYILTHDLHELWTGDIPAPMKRNEAMRRALEDIEANLPQPTEWRMTLTDFELALFKFCDAADCYHYFIRNADGFTLVDIERARQYMREAHNRLKPWPEYYRIAEDYMR